MAPELHTQGVAATDVGDLVGAPALSGADSSTPDGSALGSSPLGSRGPGSRDPGRLALLVLAPVLVSIAVLIFAGARLDAPFSPRFDGFNTAVWSSGAQAVRADGWWDTRLGATAGPSGADVPYAHHPPLVRLEVAVSTALLGDHNWADRLPALLSTLAAIWLCWGWLGACGFSPGPRSFGVLALGTTAFMARYSVMLNMEAIWLPFAFALLWAWQRAERRGGGFWSCCLVGLIGCTASHQGMLLAGGFALWSVIAAVRQRRRPRPHEVGVIVAAAAGAAVFLVWVVWASGGLTDLVRIAGTRTRGGVTWAEFIYAQWEHGLAVFGLIGLVCAVAGVILVRRRPPLVPPMAVLCGVTLVYAVGFRQGATIHEYWNVALVPVVALGGALLAERLVRFGPRVVPALCVLAALIVLATSVTMSRDISGDGAGLMARVAGARGVPTLYSTEIVSDWITYESGGPAKGVYDCAAVRRLAARDADTTVLTSRSWIERRRAGGWSSLAGADGVVTTIDGYALTNASEVASAC